MTAWKFSRTSRKKCHPRHELWNAPAPPDRVIGMSLFVTAGGCLDRLPETVIWLIRLGGRPSDDERAPELAIRSLERITGIDALSAAGRPVLMSCTRRLIAAALTVLSISTQPSATTLLGRAETDLDAFMRQVLARRDDNWKKLQQYILDERERIELRGPTRQRMWGEEREYTWYIREGFFVRSPVRFNGVTVGD